MGNFWSMKNRLLFTLLFLGACGTSNETKDDFVARVGDEKLTKKNLLFLVGNQASDASFYYRAINKWVENKLLYKAALSVGLDKDLLLSKERDLFYENLLISSFIEIQTREKTKTTKKEVSDYYLKNKDSFKRTDDEVVVKHFVFKTKAEAKKTIKDLKKKKPKKDIEKILNEQRVETKIIRKKDAGTNLAGFVFSGVVGDFLGPEKHKDGFHVFQVLQKHKKGSYLGLERVYDEIYHRIYKEKRALVLDAVLDSLYLGSDVFVSQEIINK